MSAIQLIRSSIREEVFDHSQVREALKEYRKPKDAVTRLLSDGSIIRLRKGLYIFGEAWRRQPISPTVLAGLVYGPSIVSLDYALSYYGWIPERVVAITCITPGRSREFQTPLGLFSYTHLSARRFGVAFTRHLSGKYGWLLATPLKALADKVWFDARFQPTSPASYRAYLLEDLRLDEQQLSGQLDAEEMKAITDAYDTRKITWLMQALTRMYLS
jgi:hypothetical protein